MYFKVTESSLNRLAIQISTPRLFFLFPQITELSLNKVNHLASLKTSEQQTEIPLLQLALCDIVYTQNTQKLWLWQVQDCGLYGRRFLGKPIYITHGRECQLQALKKYIDDFLQDHPFKVIYHGSMGTWIAHYSQQCLDLHYETPKQPVFSSRTHYCEYAYLVDLNKRELVVTISSLIQNSESQLSNHQESKTYAIDRIKDWRIEKDEESDERIIIELEDDTVVPISGYMDYFPTKETRSQEYGGYGPSKFAITTLKNFINSTKSP
jgi:hypothetical protein